MTDRNANKAIRVLLRGIGAVSVVVAVGLIVALCKWTIITVSALSAAAVICLLTTQLHAKTDWGSAVLFVLAFPAMIILGIIYLAGPALGGCIAILGATFITIIFAGVVDGIYYIIAGKFSIELLVFSFVCFETIFLSNHTDAMKNLLRRTGIWKIWDRDDTKHKLLVIGDYFFQTENMHFIISLAYVVYLFIMAFMNITGNGNVFSEGIDNAIWKAFLVYIAYTTMVSRYQKTEATLDDTEREIFKLLFGGNLEGLTETYNVTDAEKDSEKKPRKRSRKTKKTEK